MEKWTFVEVLSKYPTSLWLYKVIPNDTTSKICFIYLVLVNLWLTEDSNTLPSSCFVFWNPMSHPKTHLKCSHAHRVLPHLEHSWNPTTLDSYHCFTGNSFLQTLVSPRSLKRGMHFTLLWSLSPEDWIRISLLRQQDYVPLQADNSQAWASSDRQQYFHTDKLIWKEEGDLERSGLLGAWRREECWSKFIIYVWNYNRKSNLKNATHISWPEIQ